MEERRCIKCYATLTSDNHWESSRKKRNWVCKKCHRVVAHEWYLSHKEEIREYNLAYNKAHKADIRMQQIQRRYNVDSNRWESMLRTQVYSCYLCGGKFGTGLNLRPEIDPHHTRGKIRGLAHGGCNRAIGILGENPEIFERIAAALRMLRLGIT